jgi:hypothetical protein
MSDFCVTRYQLLREVGEQRIAPAQQSQDRRFAGSGSRVSENTLTRTSVNKAKIVHLGDTQPSPTLLGYSPFSKNQGRGRHAHNGKERRCAR